MQYDFTPGAERALASANLWTCGGHDNDLGPPEMILGLLAEPECRSALVLARYAIDEQVVRQRWPALRPVTAATGAAPRPFSPALGAAVAAARELLFEHPQPVALATEHLLLGLLVTPGEMADWLRQRGLDAEKLEADVHRWAGHVPGPLAVEEEKSEVGRRKAEIATSGGQGRPLNNGCTAPSSSDFRLSTSDFSPALRILDAAANRAAEGLRVVEDYVRFVLDDRHLTEKCKSLRHELAQLLAVLPDRDRLAARDSLGDVAADLTVASQATRADPADVATASWKRIEQALRSLEEFSKTVQPELAVAIGRLRYRAYTLERAAGIAHESRRRLADVRLYVLADGRASPAEFERLVAALVAAGVHAIQLRDKRLCDRELIERARLLRAATRGAATLAIVNDRADIAVATDADGVHVGQEELTVKDARTVLGPRKLIGVSTHNIGQARQAVLDGADYLGVGPTFASQTKQFAEFSGLDFARAVSAEIGLPAFAIGGITSANVAQVLAAGMARVAVGSAVVDAADPAAAAIELLMQLEGRSRKGGGRRDL